MTEGFRLLPRLWIIVEGKVVLDGDVRVRQFEVRRLIFVVVRPTSAETRQQIEGDLSVGLGVLWPLALARWLQTLVVWFLPLSDRSLCKRVSPGDVGSTVLFL